MINHNTHNTSPPLSREEEIAKIVEKHQGLRVMRQEARQIFEFDDDQGLPPTEKIKLKNQKHGRLNGFARKLSGFEKANMGNKDHILQELPDQQDREDIAKRLILIAQTAEGYIDDTPELKPLLSEAKDIVIIYVGHDPLKRSEKETRLKDLQTKLDDFYTTSPLAPGVKQEIIDNIWEAAHIVTKEDLIEAYKVKEDPVERQRNEAYNRIHDRIDEADRITDREMRGEALAAIARENKVTSQVCLNEKEGDAAKRRYSFTFVDLGIEASRRIRTSKHHNGLRMMYLGKVKKFGEWDELHDVVLKEISEANNDNENGLKAAKGIRWEYRRNETLAARANEAVSRMAGLHRGISQAEGAKDSTALADFLKQARERYSKDIYINTRARNLIKGQNSGQFNEKAEVHAARETLDPKYLSLLGLRAFRRNQQALHDIAVQRRDEKTARRIVDLKLQRHAINEIRRLNASS